MRLRRLLLDLNVPAARRAALIVVVALGAPILLILAEVAIALSREYLPTDPPMRLGGTFGPVDGEPLRFVVLGDSTGAGVGAEVPANAYPTLLAEGLAASGRRVELLVFAVSGARTQDVLVDQVPKAVAAEPDVVFVGIGANDATHFTRLGEVHDDMELVLERLRATGAVVVVAGAPDMRAEAFLEPLRSIVGYRGRRVAEAIAEAAAEAGVPVVPLAEQTGPVFADDPDHAYSADRFHPGPGGYRAWADAILPVLRDALGL